MLEVPDGAVKVNSRGTVRPNFDGDSETRDPEEGNEGGARLALRGNKPLLLPVEAARLVEVVDVGKASDRLALKGTFGLFE